MPPSPSTSVIPTRPTPLLRHKSSRSPFSSAGTLPSPPARSGSQPPPLPSLSSSTSPNATLQYLPQQAQRKGSPQLNGLGLEGGGSGSGSVVGNGSIDGATTSVMGDQPTPSYSQPVYGTQYIPPPMIAQPYSSSAQYVTIPTTYSPDQSTASNSIASRMMQMHDGQLPDQSYYLPPSSSVPKPNAQYYLNGTSHPISSHPNGAPYLSATGFAEPSPEQDFTERFRADSTSDSEEDIEEEDGTRVSSRGKASVLSREEARSVEEEHEELRSYTDIEPAVTDDQAESSGIATEDPMSDIGHRSTTEDKIPRPRNPWILYRSAVIDNFADGGELPGLYEFLSNKHDQMVLEGKGATSDPVRVMAQFRARHKKAKGVRLTGQEGKLADGKMMGIQHADLTKLISPMWKGEPDNVRVKYERQADVLKIEHQRMYPDYKFQPMKKEEKEKLKEQKFKDKVNSKASKVKKATEKKPAASRKRPSKTIKSPTVDTETETFITETLPKPPRHLVSTYPPAKKRSPRKKKGSASRSRVVSRVELPGEAEYCDGQQVFWANVPSMDNITPSSAKSVKPSPQAGSQTASPVDENVPVSASYTSSAGAGPLASDYEGASQFQPSSYSSVGGYQPPPPSHNTWNPPVLGPGQEIGWAGVNNNAQLNVAPFIFECLPPLENGPMHGLPAQQPNMLQVPGSMPPTQNAEAGPSTFALEDLDVDPALLAGMWDIMNSTDMGGGDQQQHVHPDQWADDPAEAANQWSTVGLPLDDGLIPTQMFTGQAGGSIMMNWAAQGQNGDGMGDLEQISYYVATETPSAPLAMGAQVVYDDQGYPQQQHMQYNNMGPPVPIQGYAGTTTPSYPVMQPMAQTYTYTTQPQGQGAGPGPVLSATNIISPLHGSFGADAWPAQGGPIQYTSAGFRDTSRSGTGGYPGPFSAIGQPLENRVSSTRVQYQQTGLESFSPSDGSFNNTFNRRVSDGQFLDENVGIATWDSPPNQDAQQNRVPSYADYRVASGAYIPYHEVDANQGMINGNGQEMDGGLLNSHMNGNGSDIQVQTFEAGPPKRFNQQRKGRVVGGVMPPLPNISQRLVS